MDLVILKKHIENYKQHLSKNPDKYTEDMAERRSRCDFYQAWTKDRILQMSEEDLYQYISKLWAMLIWGNKKYVVDKMVQDNGLDGLRRLLADLVWGAGPLVNRWDSFKKNAKGFGPAMISEILCYVHPAECMVWNRRAYVGFNLLGIDGLPTYNYQMTGQKYSELSTEAKKIADEMQAAGLPDASLLAVDYLIWDEMQVENNLSNLQAGKQKPVPNTAKAPALPESLNQDTSDFIHNEIRDKLADIGRWLGFNGSIEKKVAEGSKIDTIWEATIGNMGRVIYVFEVQTKGSIDSLTLNLLKALNNPAVQGVVAVSDEAQLLKISKQSKDVPGLSAKLKCWDYKKVLEIHAALEMVNESINSLGLVPQGF
jgi:hypothetical protein